ncbi:MAG: PCRF domain-containing protein, partial [Verrucomicrobia bacterium]|nr:PCRF domain-containing protein [Verrucomicrobiota bacterium]
MHPSPIPLAPLWKPKTSLTFWRSTPARSRAACRNSGGIFDIPLLTQKIEELEAKAANPEFWNRQEQAREVLAETKLNKDKLEPFLKFEEEFQNLTSGIELAKEFDDIDSAREARSTFEKLGKDLES